MEPARRRCRQEWRELTERWKRSNFTGIEFARREGVNPSTFAWWRSELAREQRGERLTLVSVRAPVESRSNPIEVELPGGIIVRVPSTVDLLRSADLIARLMES